MSWNDLSGPSPEIILGGWRQALIHTGPRVAGASFLFSLIDPAPPSAVSRLATCPSLVPEPSSRGFLISQSAPVSAPHSLTGGGPLVAQTYLRKKLIFAKSFSSLFWPQGEFGSCLSPLTARINCLTLSEAPFRVNCVEEAPKHLAEATLTTCNSASNCTGANGKEGSRSLIQRRTALSKEGSHKPQSGGAGL